MINIENGEPPFYTSDCQLTALAKAVRTQRLRCYVRVGDGMDSVELGHDSRLFWLLEFYQALRSKVCAT